MSNLKDEVLAIYTSLFSCYEYSKARNDGDIMSLFAMLYYFLIFVLLEVSTILYFFIFVLSWNFHNFIFTNFNTTLFWENYIILLLKSSVNYEKNCLQKKSQLTFKTMEYTLLLCLNILQAQNKISSVWFYLKYFSSYFHAFFKFYKYF